MNYLPSNLEFKDGVAHIGETSLLDVANEYGTPLYVYSASYFESRLGLYNRGKEGKEDSIQFCYGMKASSNLALLRLVASRGWGADHDAILVDGREREW